MPPKSQNSDTIARRGRPARSTAPAIPVTIEATSNPPKKRGRPSKTDTIKPVTVGSPKKRGRPAKATSNETIAQIDSAIKRGRRSIAAAEEAVATAPVAPKKRPGRPSKAAQAEVALDVVAPKKRGRPPVVAEASATPKRGRPALNLNRVAGSPRVAKRSSTRSKPVARVPRAVPAAPRINPKMRSRLRNRTTLVEKVKTEVAQPVQKARGRPKKVQVEAPAPTKTVGRKASTPKTAAPRKRRGYTAIEVPDKFAAQVKQLIVDLQTEDAANAAAAAGEADDEGEDIEVEIELGPEEIDADLLNDPPVEQEEEVAAELEEGDVEEDDHMSARADVVDLDEEEPLAEGVQSEADIDIGDETELPSETAVLAEIAGVQDDFDDQDDIQDDVQGGQAAIERQRSPSDVSIDLHEEIIKVSAIPQLDGSNEVNVFHAHVDEHAHVHQYAPPTEPAVGPAFGSLLGGL